MTTVANITTSVAARIFTMGESITTTSEPSQAEILLWINEVCAELITVCAETNSEVGRLTASFSTAADVTYVGTVSSYYLSSPVFKDKNGKQYSAWIVKTNEKKPLTLTTEAAELNYAPSETGEPDEFYIDGLNRFVFLPTPDAIYTVKIPYYANHTYLTLTTSTIPFNTIFDNLIIEAVTMRAQNRDEYDLSFELRWYSYLREQAKKIIYMRKNETVRFIN